MSAGRIAAVVAALASTVLVAAGCGSSGSQTTTTSAQTAPQQWADGLCQAVDTYVGALRSAGAGLQTDVSQNGLDDARNAVKDATSTFTSAVGSLGRPSTASGREAQQEVQQLASSVEQQASKIKDATESVNGAKGVFSAVTVVGGALVSAKDQVAATVQKLQTLPHGELKQAFSSSQSCATVGQ